MRRQELIWRGSDYKDKPVVAFYSGPFSNFARAPHTFVIPETIWREGYPRSVNVRCSEQSIMLCKACLFDDRRAFDAIMKATAPVEMKRLGRQVQRFDDDVWQQHLLLVARETVEQKFRKSPGYQQRLLDTKDALLVEASHTDRIWGIGMDERHPNVTNPDTWPLGSNVLGWALMQARQQLSL